MGPGVSIGEGSQMINVRVKDSMIQKQTIIENAQLDKAMIGNHVRYNGEHTSISLGDYSELN